jgi:hypothetical protein
MIPKSGCRFSEKIMVKSMIPKKRLCSDLIQGWVPVSRLREANVD